MAQKSAATTPTSGRDVELSRAFLTMEEAAKELRICRTTMYGLLRNRALSSITIGRRRLIPRDQLTRFCATREQMTLPPGAQQGGSAS